MLCFRSRLPRPVFSHERRIDNVSDSSIIDSKVGSSDAIRWRVTLYIRSYCTQRAPQSRHRCPCPAPFVTEISNRKHRFSASRPIHMKTYFLCLPTEIGCTCAVKGKWVRHQCGQCRQNLLEPGLSVNPLVPHIPAEHDSKGMCRAQATAA